MAEMGKASSERRLMTLDERVISTSSAQIKYSSDGYSFEFSIIILDEYSRKITLILANSSYS